MIFDEFDQIRASEKMKTSTLNKVMEKQKQRRKQKQDFMKLASVCACFFMLIWLFKPWQQISNYQPSTTIKSVYSYITLDINPSMEWHLDEEKTIIDVIFYNQDAKILTEKINILGMSLEKALQQLMNSEDFQSYLDTGFLEVSVYSKDTNTSLSLEKELNNYLQKHIDSNNYHCSHLDEETHHSAQQHYVSAGRYRIIEEILYFDSSYSIEELEKRSMKELYALLGNYTNDKDFYENERHRDEHHAHR